MTRLRRAITFIDNHWLGDAIGCLCLFATAYLALIFIAVMQ